MTSNKKHTMQFLFGDRELILRVEDLLTAQVDVIVNAANGSLLHGGGVAAQILEQGGAVIQEQSHQFIKEHGTLESGMVAFTAAGNLPYKAVLHAVGPRMGEGEEQRKIEQAVSRSLMLCSMHDWHSVAFPAISSGIFGVPIEIVAQGFFRSITSFWDARMDTPPDKVIICLTEKNFRPFLDAFRDESIMTDEEISQQNTAVIKPKSADKELAVGLVDLSDETISKLDDDEVNDWFK